MARSILITGCSSGIGFDAAVALREEGWRVFATCRKPEDVARMEALGFESFALDLADPHSVAEGAARVLAETDGKIDALFNNGAFVSPGAVEDLPRDALRAIFETNLFGQFDLANRLIPAMKAEGRGRIIFNSSVLGLVVKPYGGAYASTKFAMEALSDAMRMENRDTPLHVILIEPGPIPSRIRINSRAHFERWIDVETSAHKKIYEDMLIPALYNQDNAPSFFELPVSATSKVVLTALTHPRPRARYYVTKITYIADALRRVLPTSLLDAILARR